MRILVTQRLAGDFVEKLAEEHEVEVWPEKRF